jgi:signal transduction histidine kinase
MGRLHAARMLSFAVDVDASLHVRARREDLDEMLGNLLDNACKWTRSRVVVTAVAQDGSIEIVVDDDGAGVEAAKREVVVQRGVRADEATPGSGLGLAIVRDLAELHGGSIVLETASIGGLRVCLRLPRT